MTSSELFRRNPNVIVNNVGGGEVVLYIPPNPRPLRIPSNIWRIFDSFNEDAFSLEEWNQALFSSLNFSAPDKYDFEWLVRECLLLPLTEKAVESSMHSSDQDLRETQEFGESGGLEIFTYTPTWNPHLRNLFYQLFKIELAIWVPMGVIVVAYLIFFVFSPTSASIAFFNPENIQPSTTSLLSKTLIALFSVNMISTACSWLCQSITGNGDGKVLLRFLFGFIPRFGINPYKGSAMHSTVWNKESFDALLCLSQPLLTRLTCSAALILLFSTGRLHSGFAGGYWSGVLMVVLQISLISGAVLALPFRQSPGYRLMILLSDLPMSTLGRSLRLLQEFLLSFVQSLNPKNRTAQHTLFSLLSSKRDVALLLFAFCFSALILGKLALVLIFVIPGLAASFPSLFGRATRFILTFILLVLLVRFIIKNIVPKIGKLSQHRKSSESTIHSPGFVTISQSANNRTLPLSVSRTKYLVLAVSGLSLFVPINRTITGSVLVSTQRDLTVRAPEDVVITSIFRSGPSSEIVEDGTKLIELESPPLQRDLYLSELEIVELNNDLDVLIQKVLAEKLLLYELTDSLTEYLKASTVLLDQWDESKKLADLGAVSRQAVQELELKYFDIKEKVRMKRQQILEANAELKSLDLKIIAIEKSIKQSRSWNELLRRQKQQLSIVMPFTGLITSSTSGLLGSFVPKGETLLELKQGSLDRVTILIPDHDRSRLRIDQQAVVRLYANPTESLSGIVSAIRPSGILVDQKVFFEATLQLEQPLSPQLLQSSGAARIKSGQTNLFLIICGNLGRFLRVDVWSWTP